jgi:hypothetical protein
MSAPAAAQCVRIDKVFDRLLDEVPATILDALAPSSQLSWRDFNGDKAMETLARAEWTKIRDGQVANIALVRTWRVYRFIQRAVPPGTSIADADKLVPQAEAFVDRCLARLSRRYPALAAAQPPSANWNVLNDLTARVNGAWQGGAGALYSQNDRGELERIDPAGRRLMFSPDRNYPEWVIVIEVSSPKDAGKFGAARRRLYLPPVEADALVVEVKRSLGLPVLMMPAPTVPRPGITTSAAQRAEEKAGQLIAERVERGERPENISELFEQLSNAVAPIGHLSDAGARRQWEKFAPAEWKKGGRRKQIPKP